MAEGLHLVINGRQVWSRVAPQLAGGTLLIPLRTAVENCGGSVDCPSQPSNAVLAALDGVRLEVKAGDSTAWLDGQPFSVPVAPVLHEETLLVPAEALRALGLGVDLAEGPSTVLCGCLDPYLKGRRTFLDPGHGGSDPGALGPGGIREADLNLVVAVLTGRLVSLAGGLPLLSRSVDRTLSVAARAKAAAANRADVFLSVHCNSFTDPAVRGSETYYYETWEGHRLAAAVQQEVVGEVGLADRGVKEAGFYVLRHAQCPACLVELGFVTNPGEAAFLDQVQVKLRAALALFRGLRRALEHPSGPLG